MRPGQDSPVRTAHARATRASNVKCTPTPRRSAGDCCYLSYRRLPSLRRRSATDKVRPPGRWRTTLLIGDAVPRGPLRDDHHAKSRGTRHRKIPVAKVCSWTEVDQDAATATILDLTLCALVEHAGEFDAKGRPFGEGDHGRECYKARPDP